MTTVAARCPLRPGDWCTLCVPGATGPQDCPTVAEVMRDPDLRERLAELRREAAGVSPRGPRRA
ncbi:hypothetical protein NOCA180104 [metagenome]|uniref:Uncharacterized protein n=1 Tax=metagenome TaxID=256318 RepID=A0A2P2CKJ2_9ZZZZ